MAMATVAAAMVGCDNKSTQQTVGEVADTTTVIAEDRDFTLYGVCGDGSAMNTLQLITDEGDTMDVSIADANDRGLCHGGFQSGDRMAVILGEDETTAVRVINMTALLGDWVTSAPSGRSQAGISLREDGVAERIGDGVEYRSWRLFNGWLEIETVRDGATETNLYEIVSIGPDSLVFKDEANLFEYSRK